MTSLECDLLSVTSTIIQESQKFDRASQRDQIWQNFATLAQHLKILAILKEFS